MHEYMIRQHVKKLQKSTYKISPFFVKRHVYIYVNIYMQTYFLFLKMCIYTCACVCVFIHTDIHTHRNIRKGLEGSIPTDSQQQSLGSGILNNFYLNISNFLIRKQK